MVVISVSITACEEICEEKEVLFSLSCMSLILDSRSRE
jgi:hypothetical protein